jgi:hypothetical protein
MKKYILTELKILLIDGDNIDEYESKELPLEIDMDNFRVQLSGRVEGEFSLQSVVLYPAKNRFELLPVSAHMFKKGQTITGDVAQGEIKEVSNHGLPDYQE